MVLTRYVVALAVALALPCRAAVTWVYPDAASISNAWAAAGLGDVLLVKGDIAMTNGIIPSLSTKAVTLMGGGPGKTTIYDYRSGGTTADPFLFISYVAGYHARVCGFDFRNGDVVTNHTGFFLAYNGHNTNGSFFRFDHNRILGVRQNAVAVSGGLAVLDHNTFTTDSGTPGQVYALYTRHANWDNGTFSDFSFEHSLDRNSTNYVFVEDNSASHIDSNTAMFDSNSGARVVYRFNRLTNTVFEAHGSEEDPGRSTRDVQLYGNHFSTNGGVASIGNGMLNQRGGTSTVCSNTFDTPATTIYAVTANAYRISHGNEPLPWYGADGTNPWDVNAAGGPFETGTHTAGPSSLLVDTNKAWTVDQWTNRYAIKNITVSSNLNHFSVIDANTADTITPRPNLFTTVSDPTLSFSNGDSYEIWRLALDGVWDATGRGRSDAISGRPTPSPFGGVAQDVEGCYGWSNVVNGVLGVIASTAPSLQEGTSFFNQTPRPAWSPAAYPHPAIAATALPPATPNSPSPSNGATGVNPNTVILSWSSLYSFYHDIKLDTVNPPVATLATAWETNNIIPPPLAANTTYYWRATSHNIDGDAAGPVFSFSTGGGGSGPTVSVITPTRTSLTNGMLTYGTNGYVVQATGIQVATNLTTLVGIGTITVNNITVITAIYYQGTNILTLLSGQQQVFSGLYGGLLPSDTPTATAALAYDLDTPGTLYTWLSPAWY